MAVETKPGAKELIVAMTEDGQNIVINHPYLEPDAEGCGHIVFSPAQATHLAMLLLQKVKTINGVICGHCGDLITQEGGWATALFRYCFKDECQEEFYKEAQAMIRKVHPETAALLADATGNGFWCSGTAANVRDICTIQCAGCHDEQKRKNLSSNHAPEQQTFTCPECGAVSYNPGDILNRYCGACHEFAK
jgi:transcription elongation factor Elf1